MAHNKFLLPCAICNTWRIIVLSCPAEFTAVEKIDAASALQKKFLSRDLRIGTPLIFILPVFRIKRTMLRILQFQREPWPDLLERTSLAIFLEFVTIMPKKHEISLIVKCYTPPSFKVGSLRNHWRQLTCNSTTESCRKIIQEQLRFIVYVTESSVLHLLS